MLSTVMLFVGSDAVCISGRRVLGSGSRIFA